jgi:thioredoxin-like negative regulator of GroEL
LTEKHQTHGQVKSKTGTSCHAQRESSQVKSRQGKARCVVLGCRHTHPERDVRDFEKPRASLSPLSEIKALFEHAHTLNPNYLFGCMGLARCLCAEGAVEKAKELLASVMEQTNLHVSEYRAVLLTQRHIAVQEGDREAVRSVDKLLKDLEKEFKN